MPRSIFQSIYKDLKQKIEEEIYEFQELLPSENQMVDIYHCSRNTIRRAIGLLVADGYVQTLHGKGVRVIYQPVHQTSFSVGGIESFQESVKRNGLTSDTKIIQFAEIEADERVAKRTGFAAGSQLYYIQRLRYLDGKPLIFDINIFLKSIVPGITKEIAQKSIYDYIEQELSMTIVTSKRTMTVEHVTQLDEKYIDLKGYNCMAVITSQTYNADGEMFEYTQSRHHPDYFCFQDTAVRKKN